VESTVQLEAFFPYRLAIAAEAFSRNLAEVYGRAFGLSRGEWRLLFLLQSGDPIDSVELARRCTLDRVQVTRAAQRLESKGLIVRKVAENDRRLRIYRCTPEGLRLFAAALPGVEARARKILEALSPEERAALEKGVSALIDSMSADPGSEGADGGMPVLEEPAG